MKKIKFLPKVQERPPFLTQILKIAECGRFTHPPTPTPLARCALGSGATRFQCPFPPAVSPPFFPLANALVLSTRFQTEFILKLTIALQSTPVSFKIKSHESLECATSNLIGIEYPIHSGRLEG